MSGSFTSTAGFTTLEFISNQNTRISEAVSGKTQRIKVGGQYWILTLKSPPMSKQNFMADYSFLIQQGGSYDSFTVVPPNIGSTQGTATDVSTVTQTYGAGSLSVRANGADGTLKKGDLIKFSNHNKVYMLTADVDMDASSEDTIAFYPALNVTVNNTTTIIYNDVPITVFIDSTQQKFSTQTDGYYRYDITLREEI